MHWYVDVLKKYADFSGRARRSEYWFFALFNTIVMLALLFIGWLIDGDAAQGPGQWLYFLYLLAVLLPSLAVNVRRLHDIGKSGWYVLIALIPFIGPILVLIWHCMDSDPGTNQYGPNPKTEAFVPG